MAYFNTHKLPLTLTTKSASDFLHSTFTLGGEL